MAAIGAFPLFEKEFMLYNLLVLVFNIVFHTEFLALLINSQVLVFIGWSGYAAHFDIPITSFAAFFTAFLLFWSKKLGFEVLPR